MPSVLLPNTASPFAPRSPPNVVLNRQVDPWLTATLKRINRVKRPLNSAPQHMRCLTETLSSTSAIWNLCSLMVPRAPESKLQKQQNPICDALTNLTLLHIQAYVVHIDLVLSNEIVFKLSSDTIQDLITYHKEIYLVDQEVNTWLWSQKDAAIKKLHEEFVQTVNKYVYRTDAIALEGIEEDGAGELLGGRAEEVKNAVQGFFLPLLPPPPKVEETIRPAPTLLPSTGANWWVPTQQTPLHPVEPWKVIPSSPADGLPATTTSPEHSPMWANVNLSELATNSPPSYYSVATTQGFYQTSPLVPQLPLPSLMAQQCNPVNSFGMGWDRGFPDYATTI